MDLRTVAAGKQSEGTGRGAYKAGREAFARHESTRQMRLCVDHSTILRSSSSFYTPSTPPRVSLSPSCLLPLVLAALKALKAFITSSDDNKASALGQGLLPLLLLCLRLFGHCDTQFSSRSDAVRRQRGGKEGARRLRYAKRYTC